MKKLQNFYPSALIFFLAGAFFCFTLNKFAWSVFPYSVKGIWLFLGSLISNNSLFLGWNWSWFLGYPFLLSSNPFFVWGLNLMVSLFGSLEIEVLYNFVVSLGFCSLPIAFYCFLRRLSLAHWASLGAALWFVFTPSVLYIFPLVGEQGREVGFPPFVFFSTFLLGRGPEIIGLALALLSLSLYRDFLNHKSKEKRKLVFTVILTILSAFVASSIVTFLVVGGICLFLAEVLANFSSWRDYLYRSLFVVICVLLVACIWYGPVFWWHSLMAPSLAGKNLYGVVIFLVKVAITLLPLVLGLWMVKGRRWVKDRRVSFCLLFSISFWLLTLGRFIADYDFWQDYVAYGIEVDIGVALIVGLLIEYWLKILSVRVTRYVLPVFCFLLLFLWRSGQYVLYDPFVQYGKSYSESFEYQISRFLKENVKSNERVFVSGSLTFWLNRFAPEVMQVRGGDEPASIHPYWAHAAYQIREGGDPELADLWLRALGVCWAVVHTSDSADVYQDFIHPEKFLLMSQWEKVYDYEGNQIFHLESEQCLLLRSVDAKGIRSLAPPQDGDDKQALQKYVESIKTTNTLGLKLGLLSNGELKINADKPIEGALSLAVSYDPRWQLRGASDEGRVGQIEPDVLGNMLIELNSSYRSGELTLVYRLDKRNWIVNILLAVIGLLLVVLYPRSYTWFKNKVSNSDIMGIIDEDIEY
ncbi:hypothetical protein KKB83_00500 [Patescibacteria group bacterium]|nr:hypothetical protein [Patescibacteria group bacterium]